MNLKFKNKDCNYDSLVARQLVMTIVSIRKCKTTGRNFRGTKPQFFHFIFSDQEIVR